MRLRRWDFVIYTHERPDLAATTRCFTYSGAARIQRRWSRGGRVLLPTVMQIRRAA